MITRGTIFILQHNKHNNDNDMTVLRSDRFKNFLIQSKYLICIILLLCSCFHHISLFSLASSFVPCAIYIRSDFNMCPSIWIFYRLFYPISICYKCKMNSHNKNDYIHHLDTNFSFEMI